MGWKKFDSRRKIRKKSIFLRRWFLVLLGSGFLIMFAGVVVVWLFASKYRARANTYDLALINEIEQPSVIYDRNAIEVGRIFSENRDPCKVEDISNLFVETLIAAEDARFFSHNGYDTKGIARVLWDMVKNKGQSKTGGASTLTQQLARNAYHLQDEANRRGESTKERKIVEIFLARRIEEKYNKSQILEYYVNRVNFGGGFHGVRSASLGYFGKEPKDLEVHECASLVGAIRNPAVYSPTRWSLDKETGKRVQGRNNLKVRNRVLVRMAEEGIITKSECDAYKLRPLGLNQKPIQRGTSHFHDRVAAKFEKVLEDAGVSHADIAKGGFNIFTTVDKAIQHELETKIEAQMADVESHPEYQNPKYTDYVHTETSRPKYIQAAGMAIDHHTGEVLGYVGGRDFVHSQYDFIDSGQKPMGTIFFPFIYASAIEKGMSLGDRLTDRAMDNRQVMVDGVEGILGEWGSEVEKPRYEGDISMRSALAKSKVAATVRLGRKIGLNTVWDTAEAFGFNRPDGSLLNKTLLGSEQSSLLNLVKAYGAFANGGKRVEKLVWISKIEDANRNVLYEWKGTGELEQIISKTTAFLIHSALEEALKKGSGKRVFEQSNMGNFIGGGKSGTTHDFSNHWFVGYDSRVTCGVWAGFYDGSNNEIYPDAFSVDTVMPVWLSVMKQVGRSFGLSEIKAPDEIVSVKICKHSGMVTTKSCEEFSHDTIRGEKKYVSTSYDEFYHRDQIPRGTCTVHGTSLGEFHHGLELGEMSSLERLNTVPIKPKKPTLVGEDPYKSEASIYASKANSFTAIGRGFNSMNFELTEKLETGIIIPIEEPARVTITD